MELYGSHVSALAIATLSKVSCDISKVFAQASLQQNGFDTADMLMCSTASNCVAVLNDLSCQSVHVAAYVVPCLYVCHAKVHVLLCTECKTLVELDDVFVQKKMPLCSYLRETLLSPLQVLVPTDQGVTVQNKKLLWHSYLD